MILFSFPVVDEMSSADPVSLVLEYENGFCWLEVMRLGVHLVSRGSIAWDGEQWWRCGVNQKIKHTSMYELRDEPLSTDQVCDLIVRETLTVPSLAVQIQVPRPAIRAALDERRMSELFLTLDVMES